MGVSNRVYSSYREVHKARHRATGSMVALKKILMHNAKEEGVSLETSFLACFFLQSAEDSRFFIVSDHCVTGDQDLENAITQEHRSINGNGR